jgi:hypothetical protein
VFSILAELNANGAVQVLGSGTGGDEAEPEGAEVSVDGGLAGARQRGAADFASVGPSALEVLPGWVLDLQTLKASLAAWMTSSMRIALMNQSCKCVAAVLCFSVYAMP